MARYKGKREAPRPEKAGLWKQTEEERPLELVRPAAEPQPMTPAEAELFSEPLTDDDDIFSDPFEQDTEEKKESAFLRFFRSKKGKIVTVALCCVLAFVVGGLFALKDWVKPPDLPDKIGNNQQNQIQQNTQDQDTAVPDEPDTPTDDELYPDDGFGGEVPEVSGDRKEGVYTFLLVGTDKDDGNTDTIMVVSYDTVNQDINIMSIPRDTMTNEKWDIKKINSVYSRYSDGMGALQKRVKTLIGFTPDFYVKVELKMFVELVDLIGGVDFYVPQDMNYDDPWQDLHIHLKEGQQVLDGEKAMQLVRFRRYAEGDIQRVKVQQDFMKALIKECISLKHWGKIKSYIKLGLSNVQTDLDFGSVVWFAANVLGLNDAPALDMANVNTYTLPGNYIDGTWCRTLPNSGKQSYVTVYANQTVKLVNESFNPYKSNVTTGNLDIMSILPNGDIASSTGNLKDTEHNAWMAVRRGEAYYDEEGKIVYGTPPSEVEVQVDVFGNYYILDEEGNIVYTDENGTPLTELNPAVPPDVPVVGPGTEIPPATGTDPVSPTDPVVSTDPVAPFDPGTGGEGDVPPEEVPTEEDDNQMPAWLLPR